MRSFSFRPGQRKVRESVKLLDKAEALPEHTAEEEVRKIEAINEASFA